MSDGAKLISAVQKAFSRIGTANGHAFPEQQLLFDNMSNEEASDEYDKERAAYEYMVAGELKSAADRRAKEAKKQVEQLGLLNAAESLAPGTSATLWAGQITTITVSVNQPTTRTDITKLSSELRKQGVSQSVIDKAIKAATVENAAAKRFKATPVV